MKCAEYIVVAVFMENERVANALKIAGAPCMQQTDIEWENKNMTAKGESDGGSVDSRAA